MNTLKTTARIAGLLMLVLVALAPFSMLYVPSTLIVPGDAVTTANNIVSSAPMFRLAMASDAVIFLVEIALCALVYTLVRPVNKALALIAVFARLAMTIIQGLNLLNHFVVMSLLSGSGSVAALAPPQLHALVSLFLGAHEAGVLIWGMFFGLHLLMLGYLVYRSGYLPKVIGGLLVFVGLVYLAQSFGTILLPDAKAVFTAMGSLGFLEIAFPVWLLIKGVKDQPRVGLVPAMA
jgi:hypothetical protein